MGRHQPDQPVRLKMIVAYDGTAFAGWQSQVHRNTVQDKLEQALKRITGSQVRIHGASRTDAGVHALAQCAHVDLSGRRLPANRWPRALNALLPPTIRVLRCKYAPASFHARFSAKGKIYRYRIWCDEVLPPLELNRAWHVPHPLDFNALKKAATIFVGRHDFAAFVANRGKREETTIRTIHRVDVVRRGACITIEFDGDGFLYKMVRLLTGTVVRHAYRKTDLPAVVKALQSGRPIGGRFVAPAGGLFLVRIRY